MLRGWNNEEHGMARMTKDQKLARVIQLRDVAIGIAEGCWAQDNQAPQKSWEVMDDNFSIHCAYWETPIQTGVPEEKGYNLEIFDHGNRGMVLSLTCDAACPISIESFTPGDWENEFIESAATSRRDPSGGDLSPPEKRTGRDGRN
jgi:hypothetical protein